MTVFNFTLSSAVSESIILKTCSLKCQKRVSKGGCGRIVMPFKKKSTFSQVCFVFFVFFNKLLGSDSIFS